MNTKKIISESISSNYSKKEEILSSIIGNGSGEKRTKGYVGSIKVLAVIMAIVLTMTVTVTAAVLSRTVEFSLDADATTKRQGENVYVTATAKNMTDFQKGIYGFTVDVNFDNSKFNFDSTYNGVGVKAADGISDDFKVLANLSAENTVTVLFYAKNTTDELAFLDKDVSGNTWGIFELCFKVKSTATEGEAVAFTPVDCKIADAKSEGTGFELANVTHTAGCVDVLFAKCGDVNGDQNIDILDLIRFKRYSLDDLGSLEFYNDAADCDGNGTIEAALDITQLRKILFEM